MFLDDSGRIAKLEFAEYDLLPCGRLSLRKCEVLSICSLAILALGIFYLGKKTKGDWELDTPLDEKTSKKDARRPSFSMGNLLMVIALVGISLAWWVDHNRPELEEYDIRGPVSVTFSIRTSPNSKEGGVIKDIDGIDFHGATIVLHKEKGGRVFPASSLINFHWQSE